MDALLHKVFAFAGSTLDLTRGCLLADGQPVPLRPKSFELLRYLVEHAGRLVSKDELIQAVWPDVTVTEESLTRCISDVRAALSDGEQVLVRTVPRRGYVLDVPVTAILNGAGASSQEQPFVRPRNLRRPVVGWKASARGPWRLGLIAGIVSAAAIALAWLLMASPVQDQPSIAVLPFANMSDDPGQDYLSAGMTEDLTTRLSKLPGMAVTARHSASRYQGKDLDPNRVGADLGVKYLLAGSVRRDGQRLRVTARLVEAGTTRQLWADTYDADLSSLFGIYDEVTRAIVLRLEARLTRAELEQSLRRAPNSLTAYDFVLRGNARLAQIHSGDRGDTLFAARQHFEQALTIDPRSAPATHGIALTYLMAYQEPTSHPAIGGEYRQQASVERALALARQAVALDEELAEARMTLARILFWRNERAESLAEYERAFALNPNLVEPRYALVLIHEGRIDEALAYLNHAMRLDPFYPPYTSFVVGKAHAVAGREEEALRWLRVSTGRMKDYRPGLVWRAASAAGMGLAEEARRHAAEILRLEPSFTVTRFVQDLALKDERQAAHARDRLIKAGLPE